MREGYFILQKMDGSEQLRWKVDLDDPETGGTALIVYCGRYFAFSRKVFGEPMFEFQEVNPPTDITGKVTLLTSE